MTNSRDTVERLRGGVEVIRDVQNVLTGTAVAMATTVAAAGGAVDPVLTDITWILLAVLVIVVLANVAATVAFMSRVQPGVLERLGFLGDLMLVLKFTTAPACVVLALTFVLVFAADFTDPRVWACVIVAIGTAAAVATVVVNRRMSLPEAVQPAD